MASRQLKTISRPPSSASSGDRVPHRPTPVTKQTPAATKIPPTKTATSIRSSSVSKSKPLPPISKTENVTSTTARPSLLLTQENTGKIFKSPKEFRKSSEANKTALSTSTVPKEQKHEKMDQTKPRPVPRKIKKSDANDLVQPELAKQQEPSQQREESVDATKVLTDAGNVTVLKTDEQISEPDSGSVPKNDIFQKALRKLSAEKDTIEIKSSVYDDSEDVSVRSTTDEEVLKITQLIVEREKAEADAGKPFSTL